MTILYYNTAYNLYYRQYKKTQSWAEIFKESVIMSLAIIIVSLLSTIIILNVLGTEMKTVFEKDITFKSLLGLAIKMLSVFLIWLGLYSYSNSGSESMFTNPLKTVAPVILLTIILFSVVMPLFYKFTTKK